jgi:hypothetical protein
LYDIIEQLSEDNISKSFIKEISQYKRDPRKYFLVDSYDSMKLIRNKCKNLTKKITNRHFIQIENIYVCSKLYFDKFGNFTPNEENYYKMIKKHLNLDNYNFEMNDLLKMDVY